MVCVTVSLKAGSIDAPRMGMLEGEGKCSGFGDTGVSVSPRICSGASGDIALICSSSSVDRE
jgi:hypothetical protein